MKKVGIFLSIAILAISCQKESSSDEVLIKKSEEYDAHFYLDGEEVTENQIDFEDESLFFLMVYGDPNDSTSERMEVRVFTDSLDYLDYGDSQGMHLSFVDQTTRHLAEYAESSGAIEYTELEGEVPQSYSDYSESYVSQQAANNGIAFSAGLPNALLHKGYSTGPTWWLHNGHGHPWLKGIGFKEEVSSITTAGVYGVHVCYHRGFFRDRLFTLWSWGNNRIPFVGPFSHLNNKGNSWWEFHI